MPKPACIPCGRFFRPLRNAMRVVEMMPDGSRSRPSWQVQPGREHADQWMPYKLWVADVWRCEGCGAEIVVGWARGPLSEHYVAGFDDLLTGDMPRIYDC